MAGYIGNKAVGLNVTTGDILGDVGVGGDVTVGDDLTVTDDAAIGGTLGVTGLLTALANITIDLAALSGNPRITFDHDNFAASNYIEVDRTSDAMEFAVNGAERFTIETNGDVTIEDGNLIVGTADHGIQFSASTKNNGTGSVSNLMKDYEIGVWTPLLRSGGSITVSSAFYVRTGDLVHVQGYVTVTPTDNSTQFQIGGLPFLTQDASASYSAISISYFGNMDIASPNFITNQNSSDYMYLHRSDGNANPYTNSQIRGLGSARAFIFGGTYRTAQ